jgi:hypothetical protein
VEGFAIVFPIARPSLGQDDVVMRFAGKKRTVREGERRFIVSAAGVELLTIGAAGGSGCSVSIYGQFRAPKDGAIGELEQGFTLARIFLAGGGFVKGIVSVL